MSDLEVKPAITNLTHSEAIGELAKSLSEACLHYKPLKKECVNPYFKSKYADLSAVIEATDAALASKGIAVIQSPLFEADRAGVTTMLVHSSGQWMRGDLLLPINKMDAQGVGSAITYARRYSYQGFVNVAAETDDDANAASGKEAAAKSATMPRPPAKKADGKNEVKTNGEDSFKLKFWRTAKATGKTDEVIRNYVGFLGYEHTDDIPPKLYTEALEWAAGA